MRGDVADSELRPVPRRGVETRDRRRIRRECGRQRLANRKTDLANASVRSIEGNAARKAALSHVTDRFGFGLPRAGCGCHQTGARAVIDDAFEPDPSLFRQRGSNSPPIDTFERSF
jgi:hypothetical protein